MTTIGLDGTGDLRVLFVVEDSTTASTVEQHLRSGGFEPVIWCVQTPHALTEALKRPLWDVVLADDSVADLPCELTLRLVEESATDLPVIFIADSENGAAALAAIEAGAHDYFYVGQLARLSWAIKRELEEAAIRQQRRLKTEEAIEQRDMFVATAAHELKTPITVVRIVSQMLMRQFQLGELAGPPALRANLHTLDQQTQRIGRLLVQLMDLSRIDHEKLTLEPKSLDLVPLVQLVLDGYRVQHGETGPNSRFRFAAAPEAIGVVDPLRFEQVLRNLLDNAVKFSPAGTPIEITLNGVVGECITLAVRDFGPGVPVDRRGEIFERYKQVDMPGRGGLGLGLHLSRQIVEAHGGRLYAEFPDDGGSIFTVLLPAPASAAPAIAVVEAYSDGATLQVDDGHAALL